MPTHIPDGFHTITPYAVVPGVARLLDFLRETCSLHMYVEDARAVYARALAAGATSLYAPELKPYGEVQCGVRDPSGNAWYIATRQA